MHLSIDAAAPAPEVVEALLRECRAHGLRVTKRPAGRAGFLVEIADPLPGVPREAATLARGVAGDLYPISVFETAPGRCRLSTLHPTAFVDLLGHPELAAAARDFERTLHAVLAAAAGRPPPADGSAPASPAAPRAP